MPGINRLPRLRDFRQRLQKSRQIVTVMILETTMIQTKEKVRLRRPPGSG